VIADSFACIHHETLAGLSSKFKVFICLFPSKVKKLPIINKITKFGLIISIQFEALKELY
jgi:hypothetical protein